MVELHPAFFWDCPDCGRENFCRGIKPEFSSSELAELREEHGVQPWECGDFVMQPTEVTCNYCGKAFASSDSATLDGYSD